MKKIITITVFFVLILNFQNNIKGQQIDTLAYVKQFEVNKANFINKPFSYLLSQMTQLRPKTVNSLPQIWKQDLTPYSIFDFTEEEKQYGSATVGLYITWKDPISRSQAFILSKQNHFNFTHAEETFYGNKIIKDIEVSKN